MQRPALEISAAIGAAAIAIAAVLFVALRGSMEDRKQNDTVSALTGGDAARGQAAISALGCGACHEVPGITGAHGRVGPSLASFGSRVFVGGVAGNSAENLVRWIEHPRGMNPNTAMPDLGIDEPTARDIAAYLYDRASWFSPRRSQPGPLVTNSGRGLIYRPDWTDRRTLLLSNLDNRALKSPWGRGASLATYR